jgi:hypothetical protein
MIEAIRLSGMRHCADVYVVRAALGRLPLRRYDVELGLITVDYDPSVFQRVQLDECVMSLGLTILRRKVLQACLDRFDRCKPASGRAAT